jgi:hypothetical protein
LLSERASLSTYLELVERIYIDGLHIILECLNRLSQVIQRNFVILKRQNNADAEKVSNQDLSRSVYRFPLAFRSQELQQTSLKVDVGRSPGDGRVAQGRKEKNKQETEKIENEGREEDAKKVRQSWRRTHHSMRYARPRRSRRTC